MQRGDGWNEVSWFFKWKWAGGVERMWMSVCPEGPKRASGVWKKLGLGV